MLPSHPYRSQAELGADEPTTCPPSPEARWENAVVGAILAATGGLGVMLGMLESSCATEAGCGAVMFCLGMHTLLGRA